MPSWRAVEVTIALLAASHFFVDQLADMIVRGVAYSLIFNLMRHLDLWQAAVVATMAV